MADRRRRWLSEEEVNHFRRLPDAVVLHIFSFLPFRDLVKTSVLSKQWRSAWISAPYIDRGAPESGLSIRTDLDWRFHFATPRKVEEASLVCGRRRYPDGPRILCDCASLSSLGVSGRRSPWHVTIHWPSLKKLYVRDDSTDDDGITKILSGCAGLESLKLRLLCHLRIDSRSLRELVIEAFCMFSLDISAPNLPSLRLSGGFALEDFRLNAASSSAEAESNSTEPPPGSLRRGFFVAEGLKFHLEKLQHGGTLRRGLIVFGLSSLSMGLLWKYVRSRSNLLRWLPFLHVMFGYLPLIS